jgi:class 3 adenylate cyclase
MSALAFTIRMLPRVDNLFGPCGRGAPALATERVERRLAAILAADVAGYSRLMGADEEGTLARLKALRRELADPKIKEHRGRIVKTTGDGLLLEFASVVDAVRCAVEVQREMAERNADVPPDRRIEFRMGINVGDIIKGRARYLRRRRQHRSTARSAGRARRDLRQPGRTRPSAR